MPRPRTRLKAPAAEERSQSSGSSSSSSFGSPVRPEREVLTLAEVAAYLRIGEAEVRRIAESSELPGRRIGDEWRFSRSAIEDWLRPSSVNASRKESLVASAGAWKDDPYLDEMLEEIYKRRGRPMTGEDP